jgi:hypothetical protein
MVKLVVDAATPRVPIVLATPVEEIVCDKMPVPVIATLPAATVLMVRALEVAAAT